MKHTLTDDVAYVIHTRPYRETSMLVDFFTQGHGLVRGVVKGVRKPKSATRGLVQPFVPLNIAWRGAGGLVSIVQVESVGATPLLIGKRLISGLYMNELIQLLLSEGQEFSSLFVTYSHTLSLLAESSSDLAKSLRLFECHLLNDLGYGIDYTTDHEGRLIQAEQYYRLSLEDGWIPCMSKDHAAILGGTLILLAQSNFESKEVLQLAKKINRVLIQHQLGGKTLQTRLLLSG